LLGGVELSRGDIDWRLSEPAGNEIRALALSGLTRRLNIIGVPLSAG
jgi:hypothetical protein